MPAAKGEAFHYQRYDWELDDLAEWLAVPAGVPVIVEGVYCLEHSLRWAYTFKIYCHSASEVRLARGLERDGEAARSQWVDQWMPAEDEYVRLQDPAAIADFIVRT